jgi:hypothetical protein
MKTIECPCCRTQVPVVGHPGIGILLNLRASLGSDVLLLERQLQILDPEKQPREHAAAVRRLDTALRQQAETEALVPFLPSPIPPPDR